jgi:quercetin dioxygenase-like cupin family protein
VCHLVVVPNAGLPATGSAEAARCDRRAHVVKRCHSRREAGAALRSRQVLTVFASLPERGQGPPQHIHRAEEEAFYVIEGTVNILLDDEVVIGTPGSFVLIPRGTVHTFWNAGQSPAKLLVIVSPPGMEDYLAEVIGNQELDAATFVEKGTAMAPKYQMQIVGSPRG